MTINDTTRTTPSYLRIGIKRADTQMLGGENMQCNECGRFTCDCEVMVTDLYGTEIVPGEEYILNNFDEAIHKDNVIRYLIEDGTHQLKTR